MKYYHVKHKSTESFGRMDKLVHRSWQSWEQDGWLVSFTKTIEQKNCEFSRYFGVVSFSGTPPPSVTENGTCEGLTRWDYTRALKGSCTGTTWVPRLPTSTSLRPVSQLMTSESILAAATSSTKVARNGREEELRLIQAEIWNLVMFQVDAGGDNIWSSCSTLHLSSFGTGFFPLPNKVNFDFISSDFDLEDNVRNFEGLTSWR